MKNTIIAVLAACTLNASANPVIVAELQKMEAAANSQLAAKDSELVVKDSQIADLLSKLAAKDSELAELKNNPDLETAVKIKFNQAVTDAKTSIAKITEEIVSKLKGNK
jgi:hypothetical protein